MYRATISSLLFILLAGISLSAKAQYEDIDDYELNAPVEIVTSYIETTIYRYVEPEMYKGELIYTYILPELPVYPPLVFKNQREQKKFNRLVYNVKKVLPLAKQARMMLMETYDVLESLPTKEEKDAHIKKVEKEIKREFTPKMKKLTYSQGKLLIKLIDRECNQSSYEIVEAFLGPTRAAFYQVFAWSFKASLKKTYDAEGDDRLVERVVRQIEAGQL